MTRINPAAERLFGARADVIGKPDRRGRARQPHRAGGRRRAAVAAAPSRRRARPRCCRGRSTGRGARSASDRRRCATPTLGFVGAVTLLEDITHLSEISRLKSEFIAAASHELRTPLTSVQMGIHLLLEGAAGTLDERQQEILQVCRDDTAGSIG